MHVNTTIYLIYTILTNTIKFQCSNHAQPKTKVKDGGATPSHFLPMVVNSIPPLKLIYLTKLNVNTFVCKWFYKHRTHVCVYVNHCAMGGHHHHDNHDSLILVLFPHMIFTKNVLSCHCIRHMAGSRPPNAISTMDVCHPSPSCSVDKLIGTEGTNTANSFAEPSMWETKTLLLCCRWRESRITILLVYLTAEQLCLHTTHQHWNLHFHVSTQNTGIISLKSLDHTWSNSHNLSIWWFLGKPETRVFPAQD